MKYIKYGLLTAFLIFSVSVFFYFYQRDVQVWHNLYFEEDARKFVDLLETSRNILLSAHPQQGDADYMLKRGRGLTQKEIDTYFTAALNNGKRLGLKDCAYNSKEAALSCRNEEMWYRFAYSFAGGEGSMISAEAVRTMPSFLKTREAFYTAAIYTLSKNAVFDYKYTEMKKRTGKIRPTEAGDIFTDEMESKKTQGVRMMKERGYKI